MKDYFILCESSGIIMSGTDISEVLKTYRIMFDDKVIGIIEVHALFNLPATDYLTAHIGLS